MIAPTMKLFVLLVCFAVAAAQSSITDEQKARWKKWSEECQSQSGVSSETITNLRNNQFDVVDDKIRAHSLCFGKKTGLIKPSGDVDVEQVRTKLRRIVSDDAEVERIVNKCAVSKGTQEETAFQVFKCLREARPKFSPV